MNAEAYTPTSIEDEVSFTEPEKFSIEKDDQKAEAFLETLEGMIERSFDDSEVELIKTGDQGLDLFLIRWNAPGVSYLIEQAWLGEPEAKEVWYEIVDLLAELSDKAEDEVGDDYAIGLEVDGVLEAVYWRQLAFIDNVDAENYLNDKDLLEEQR